MFKRTFPNRAVNKTSPLACGVGAGDRAGSHFHTGRPDLDSSLTENSSQARSASKGKRERGRRESWGDRSFHCNYTWERRKGWRDRKKKDLMVLPEVFRFLCKTVNLVKFIFFAASVFYKGSFNLFSLSPVGDPRAFFFFPSLLFCVQPFLVFPAVYLCLFSSPQFFSSLSLFFLPLWKWVF